MSNSPQNTVNLAQENVATSVNSAGGGSAGFSAKHVVAPGFKTPVTVFSGFLGSGKTTIILHLIDQLQKKEQIIYIKNEIGAENIDGQVLEGRHIKTRELLNGCICCTLVGPFISAITEVLDTFKPDRILIEASGAADPSAIALMIDGHPRLRRDGIISIIDVINFAGYKDISLTARNQTKFTDLIVFNKVELATIEQKRAVVGYVRELNTTAPIIEAPEGKLSPRVIFGLSGLELSTKLKTEQADAHHNLTEHEHHLEVDGLDTLMYDLPHVLDETAVKGFFNSPTCLPPTVFRVKAIFTTPSKTAILLNRVGSRTTFEHLSEPVDTTHLVLIGFHLQDQKQEITRALQPILSAKPEKNT